MKNWLERILGVQFVHWPELWIEIAPSNGGPYPLTGPMKGCIYKWRFRILGIEVRKWAPDASINRMF